MTTSSFTPATRPGTFARVALPGPPGSGKLFTALRLAAGFGGTTGVVDTKGGASRRYGHLFDYHVLPMSTFDPADLTRVCAVAADAGISNLIIATASAFWSGPDGMLEQVDRHAQGSRDKNAGWNAMRGVERAMTSALLGYGGNVLVTLNTRIEWVMDRDERTGLIGPQAVGTKYDQRDGFAYDFGLVLAMHDGTGTVAKTCVPALESLVTYHPGEKLAEQITAGLVEGTSGAPIDPRQVRDWALEPGRTIDDLRDRHGALVATGQTGAVVTLPAARVRELGVEPIPGDRVGDLVTVGDLLRGRAQEVRRLELVASNGRVVQAA